MVHTGNKKKRNTRHTNADTGPGDEEWSSHAQQLIINHLNVGSG